MTEERNGKGSLTHERDGKRDMTKQDGQHNHDT